MSGHHLITFVLFSSLCVMPPGTSADLGEGPASAASLEAGLGGSAFSPEHGSLHQRVGASTTAPRTQRLVAGGPVPTRPQRFEPVPKADLVPPALPPRLQYMPRPRLDRFLLDTAFVMAAPIQPRISNAWVLGSAASGAVLSYIFDVEIHQGVRSIPDPELFGFQLSYWISEFGEGAVDVAIVSLLGIVGGKRGERVCIAGLQALLATAIVSRTFKLLLRLERPSDDQWNRRWFSGMRADAFPSGHTMAAFATAAVIAEEWPLSAPFVYTLATWVGISRVQQHTHWLTDVIIGGALGALFGWEAMRLTRRFEVGLTPWVGDGAGGVVIGGKTFY